MKTNSKNKYAVIASGNFLSRRLPKEWEDDSYWEDKRWEFVEEFIDEFKVSNYDDWEAHAILEEIEHTSALICEVVDKEVSDE